MSELGSGLVFGLRQGLALGATCHVCGGAQIQGHVDTRGVRIVRLGGRTGSDK